VVFAWTSRGGWFLREGGAVAAAPAFPQPRCRPVVEHLNGDLQFSVADIRFPFTKELLETGSVDALRTRIRDMGLAKGGESNDRNTT
jgi:hypothetical protein